MAFLKIKKEFNKERPIDVQLAVNPMDHPGKLNNYDKYEYKIPCINVGGDYESQGEGSFKITTGASFDLDASQYLMDKLSNFKKGDLVRIEMAPSDRGEGQVYWKVQPSEKTWSKPVKDVGTVSEKPYGYGSVKERDIDKRLDILWGMACNNTTRIACSTDLPPKEKVKLMSELIPDVFKIMRGLDDHIEEPTEEVPNKPKKVDDDLPF